MVKDLITDLNQLANDLKAYLDDKIANLPELPLGNVYRDDYIKLRRKDVSSFEIWIERAIKEHGNNSFMYDTVYPNFKRQSDQIKREIDLIP